MENYPESRLFSNIKVLKTLLNFLKAIKMKYFKKKIDITIIRARADDE